MTPVSAIQLPDLQGTRSPPCNLDSYLMLSNETFDKAIDTWAATGSIPTEITHNITGVFRLIDCIPQFVQPLTKTQFFNIVEYVVNNVYEKPEFTEILAQRLQSPDPITRKTTIWLCCLLVPLNPLLANNLQHCKTIATVVYESHDNQPQIYECMDLDFQLGGKQAIMVYASGWKQYISLLKSPLADVSRHTAASLWSETRSHPDQCAKQIQLGVPEYAYRVFDRSSQFLPFIISWLATLNNKHGRSVLSWDRLKIILRRSNSGLVHPDRRIAESTFEAICELVGDNPWTQKKNLCDKMVDLGFHHKLIPYLKEPRCQLRAIRLIAIISETRAEELVYAGVLDYLMPLASSTDATVRELAAATMQRVSTG